MNLIREINVLRANIRIQNYVRYQLDRMINIIDGISLIFILINILVWRIFNLPERPRSDKLQRCDIPRVNSDLLPPVEMSYLCVSWAVFNEAPRRCCGEIWFAMLLWMDGCLENDGLHRGEPFVIKKTTLSAILEMLWIIFASYPKSVVPPRQTLNTN